MKDPIFGKNRDQSFVEFDSAKGRVRLGSEGKQIFLELGEEKVFLTDADGNLIAPMVPGSILTDLISEATVATGVTIDGVLLKDNDLTADEVITDLVTATAINTDTLNGASLNGLDKYVKVELSSAEILALNTTPKQLVAAPGAGKALIFRSMVINCVFVSAAYAANTTLMVINGTTTDEQFEDIWDSLGFASSEIIYLMPETGNIASVAQTLHENESLQLTAKTGDPTTGDGTLTVHLWYKEITL